MANSKQNKFSDVDIKIYSDFYADRCQKSNKIYK